MNVCICLKCVTFITVLVVTVQSRWSMDEVQLIPDVTLQNINCIRVNEVLSDENNIHMIVCDGCDVLHLKVFHNESRWQIEWLSNLTNASNECIHGKKGQVQDAIFMPADRNEYSVLYLTAQPTVIERMKYQVSSDGEIRHQQTTNYRKSNLGVCTGLHLLSNYSNSVLIADGSSLPRIPFSGCRVRMLNTSSDTTIRLENFRSCIHPHYFSSHPTNKNNVFTITSTDLRKLSFDGKSQYPQNHVMAGIGGHKVLSVTPERLFVIPESCGLKLVDLLGNRTYRLFSSEFHTYNFTGIDAYLSNVLFLTSFNKIYYITNITDFIEEVTQRMASELISTNYNTQTQTSDCQQHCEVIKTCEKTTTTTTISSAQSSTQQGNITPIILNKKSLIVIVLFLGMLCVIVMIVISVTTRKLANCSCKRTADIYDEACSLPEEFANGRGEPDAETRYEELPGMTTLAHTSSRYGSSCSLYSTVHVHDTVQSYKAKSASYENLEDIEYEVPDLPNMLPKRIIIK